MSWLKNFPKQKPKKRGFEGGSRGRRTKHWRPGGGDAAAQIRPALPILRERSRDLRRNNSHAKKGVELITNNVIGKGIKTIIQNDPTPNKQNEKDWKEWTESALFDFEERSNLFGLQGILMDAVVESGEVMARRRITDSKFPISYQILESDFLNDSQLDGIQEGGNLILQGIEFDSNGRRIGYHLHSTHPGGVNASLANFTSSSNLIPAQEVYHLFRQERPGQVRGVPWLAPVMIRLRDFSDFEDAVLMRQKVSALFVAFVRDLSAECVNDDEESEELGERMTPAMIEHLPPGKDVEFANPPDPTNYKEFTSQQLKSVAAGLGVSYEALTGDLSEVNFSSARMGWIEMGRNIDAWREKIIIQNFLKKVEQDFILMQSLRGIPTDGMTFTHVSPKREMIDPAKEFGASIKAIRAGLSSRTEEIAALGKDVKDVDERIKKDNDSIDSNEFIFDTDPRKTNQAGGLQVGAPIEE